MTKPILLVHGAWHGAWCWETVQAGLRDRDIESIAVHLPFTGLADDAATVAAELDLLTRGGSAPAVVMGHSYGGMVISEATAGRSDVDHLVYLCALLLAAGQAPLDGAEELPTRLDGALVLDDQLGSTIRPDAIVPAFYADVDTEVAAHAVARLRSFPVTALATVAGEPWRDIATTYVRCLHDEAIHPDHQLAMSAKAATVIDWETAHSPFLSHPHLVVDLLAAMAAS